MIDMNYRLDTHLDALNSISVNFSSSLQENEITLYTILSGIDDKN